MVEFVFKLTEAEKELGLTVEEAKQRRLDAADGQGIVIVPALQPDEKVVAIATGEDYKKA